MRTRHLIYLYNLDVVGICTVSIYGLFSFNTYCQSPSYVICVYQALFIYYNIYLSGYGVVLLSLYRLVCVSVYNINKYITHRNIFISLGEDHQGPRSIVTAYRRTDYHQGPEPQGGHQRMLPEKRIQRDLRHHHIRFLPGTAYGTRQIPLVRQRPQRYRSIDDARVFFHLALQHRLQKAHGHQTL